MNTRDTANGRRPKIDTDVMRPARRYNYWLGGKDNFAADRTSGDAVAEAFPGVRIAARQNREFLRRAVRRLANAGITQFLDIGPGLPAPGNTHEVAQAINPDATVVYVDNDPMVMTHARALLTGSTRGRVGHLDADLRDAASIIEHPALRDVLDFSQPVAVLCVAVLHFLTDADDPDTILRTLLHPLAPGSQLVLSHASGDPLDEITVARIQAATAAEPFTLRSHARIERLFAGLHLEPPGVVVVSDWDPDPGAERFTADQVAVYAGVARKPAHEVGTP